MRQIGEAVFLLLLAVGTRWDMQRQMVPAEYLAVTTALAALYQALWGRRLWLLWGLGLAVGVCFLLLSRFSRQGIGYGDSWMILNLGLFLGVWKVFGVLMTAFLLSAAAALIGVKRKGWGRKKRIPFYPFLLAGYLGVLLW